MFNDSNGVNIYDNYPHLVFDVIPLNHLCIPLRMFRGVLLTFHNWYYSFDKSILLTDHPK